MFEERSRSDRLSNSVVSVKKDYFEDYISDMRRLLTPLRDTLFKLLANTNRGNYRLYRITGGEELELLLSELNCRLEKLNHILLNDTLSDRTLWDMITRQEDECKPLRERAERCCAAVQLNRVFPIEGDAWKGKSQHDHYSHSLLFPDMSELAAVKVAIHANRQACFDDILKEICFVKPACDYINLSDCNLKDDGVEQLALSLERTPSILSNLEVLVLSSNMIGQRGLFKLLEVLKKYPKQKQVFLDRNRIDLDEICFRQHLLPALSVDSPIVILDLSMNFLPKGHMFMEEGGRRFYFRKEEMKSKLLDEELNLGRRTTIKDRFLSLAPPLRSLPWTVCSLLEPSIKISAEKGMIGLYIWRNGDVHFFIEGIRKKFGQRYLIQAELGRYDSDYVSTKVYQCWNEKFSGLTSVEIVKSRFIGRFSRTKIKEMLNVVCEPPVGEVVEFESYALGLLRSLNIERKDKILREISIRNGQPTGATHNHINIMCAVAGPNGRSEVQNSVGQGLPATASQTAADWSKPPIVAASRQSEGLVADVAAPAGAVTLVPGAIATVTNEGITAQDINEMTTGVVQSGFFSDPTRARVLAPAGAVSTQPGGEAHVVNRFGVARQGS